MDHILGFLFFGGEAPSCRAATDSNGDGSVDISDASHLLGYLFLGGPAPAPPFPACGLGQLEGDLALGCDARAAGCR